jgi:hypothetical protein
VSFDDQFVDVGGDEAVEWWEGVVVDDEQIDAQQATHLGVVAVVEPGGAEPFEEPVAAFEVDAEPSWMAAWPRAVATKVLPTPTGPMMTALWPDSTKRSDHSSVHTARS